MLLWFQNKGEVPKGHTRLKENRMSQSVGFPNFRCVALSFALVLMLALGAFPALAAPPSAPPLTVDPNLQNLWYGANPSGPNGPVLVFVHGFGGDYQDWIESNNCALSAGTACAGTGNDMYDYAYQAGFRTVFLSLNTNNLPNNASIQTNSAMLLTMFQPILNHYPGVTKVFFVCHSKGGLDLESAIANPQWIGLANMVITMGTPNQGDALATWIFLPANQALGSLLGLLTPAVQSMEIASVEQLRAQWDPIFQQAQIPFFTLSGNTYNCVGSGSCTTVETGQLLAGITDPQPPPAGLTPCNETGNAPKNSPCNDGLVDHPESLLPNSYAMELGIVNCNHFALRLGDNTFPFINAQVQAFQAQQPGFSLGTSVVATNGFGDSNNTWSWSMAWFENMLYVGTGRDVSCVTAATARIELGISSLYPPSIGSCTPDYHDLPLQGEIWQYNPVTNIWTRVYQSPNSLMTVDNTGTSVPTARDIGFRSLTLVTEPGGVQALYAGGVTSGEIFECHAGITTGCTTAGFWPPPRILRTTTGALGSWAPIPQNGTLTTVAGSSTWTPAPGAFLGALTANGCYGTVTPNCPNTTSYQNYSIRSAGQLPAGTQSNSVLYLQVGDFPGVGRVISSAPGANPALGDNGAGFTWASPPTSNLPVWILEVFNNFMYAGTGTPPGAPASTYGVFKTDGSGSAPYTWNEIIPDAGFSTFSPSPPDYAMSLEIFIDPVYCPGIGCLYAGTDRPNELVRIHPDATGSVPVDAVDSWDLLVGNPRTIPPGFLDAGALVSPLSGIGQYFDNGFTVHFWRMGVGGYGLYMGTYDTAADNYINPTFGPFWSQEFGTDLWRTPDGVNWQFVSKVGLGDGFNTGTRSFACAPGYGLYMGTAREVGGTQVFNLDSCTSSEGNIQKEKARAVQPAAKLASPVLCSAFGNPGAQVTLSWPPVSGAVNYLVYRIADGTSEITAPPGDPVGGSLTLGLETPLVAACNVPNKPSICTMLPEAQPAAQPAATATPFGYPGPPFCLTCLNPLTTTTYTEPSFNTLQSLYYVIAQDASGDLSAPSNVVGGPSMAPTCPAGAPLKPANKQ
jgi:hypothetical protein